MGDLETSTYEQTQEYEPNEELQMELDTAIAKEMQSTEEEMHVPLAPILAQQNVELFHEAQEMRAKYDDLLNEYNYLDQQVMQMDTYKPHSDQRSETQSNNSSNNRTRNRKRKKAQKQAQQNKSFASLTSKTKQFVSPYNASSHLPQLSKKEQQKREKQRHSALNTLKQKWMDNDQIFTQHKNKIVGIKNRGILNRNLDCYINAIIQSLLSLPLFVSIFSNIASSEKAQHIGPCTKALYDIFFLFCIPSKKKHSTMNDVNCNHTNYSNVRHPMSLIAILDGFRQSMGRQGNGQQDAQEFMLYIISSLHDEMTLKKRKTKDGKSSISTCSNQAKYEEKKEENGWKLVTKNVHKKSFIAHKLQMNESLISQLFGGEYYQMIKYKKSKRSVSYQPFFSISLDINGDKIKSVSAALQNNFCKAHDIEYKKGFGKKSELICKSPFFLILHFKRFLFEDGQCYKLNKYIAYDTKLNIGSHLLFDKESMDQKKKKLRYELRSVIVHEGDFVTHGHYLSFCRREDFYVNKANKNRRHQWLMFNDNKVEGSIDLNTVKRQQAYCLLYQKML